MSQATEPVSRLVAKTLAGSWRANPPQLQIEASELASITPQLLAAGVAGLAWRRVRNSALEADASAAQLRAQYEANTGLAVLQRQSIKSLLQMLNSAGVEYLLVKGWSAARLYPDEGLRPYVDVDVCVERRQFTLAHQLLKTAPRSGLAVDLHCEFATLGGGAWDEIYSRAQVLPLGDTGVRVPGPEDHLRIIAVHMLREGAWRPMWLCDVAAAVESRPANFDWHACAGPGRQTANWIDCALKLARELLGAEISGTPAAEDAQPLPPWLTGTVLKEWAAPLPSMKLRHATPMARHLHSPGTLVSGFRHRWPNPIEGTVVSRGSFNDLPRFPFQLTAYVMRGAQFALGLPRLWRGQ